MKSDLRCVYTYPLRLVYKYRLYQGRFMSVIILIGVHVQVPGAKLSFPLMYIDELGHGI